MTTPPSKPTILCISTYEKGQPFLREAARLGCNLILLTVEKLANADWPQDILSQVVLMPEDLAPVQILNTVTYLARTQRIDRIVALDEFDLDVAALLREHMRLPGMGQTATRYFRDKLAMRAGGLARGVPVPAFIGVFNHSDLRAFMQQVPGPWLLKPRTNASAIGIKFIDAADQLWPILEALGDLQSDYVLERFIPGDIFHAEGVTWNGDVLFCAPYQYGQPPMQTMHQGGIFSTRALAPDSPDAIAIASLHSQVIQALGLISGVTHTEFIKSHADGSFYFLETAARVGGAFIADVVEHASGLNPWVEWARLEAAALFDREYTLPPLQQNFAGSVICLARQEAPDTSAYNDPEVAEHIVRHHHAGLILKSPSPQRISSLIASYTERFLADFCAVEPPPDKPTA